MASVNLDNIASDAIGNSTPPATPTPSRKSPKKRVSGTIATENHIKSLQHEFGNLYFQFVCYIILFISLNCIESRFHGCTSKKQMIKRIIKYKTELQYIPLTLPSVTSTQTVKDFQRERVILNDVPFVPDKQDNYRNTSFVKTLEMLVKRLINREGAHCVIPIQASFNSSCASGLVLHHPSNDMEDDCNNNTNTNTGDYIDNVLLTSPAPLSSTNCNNNSNNNNTNASYINAYEPVLNTPSTCVTTPVPPTITNMNHNHIHASTYSPCSNNLSSPNHTHANSSSSSVPTSEHIANVILQRASRTGCGSDSFFMVQKLFCIDGMFVTQKVEPTDKPISLHVFIDRSHIKHNSNNNNSNNNNMHSPSFMSNGISNGNINGTQNQHASAAALFHARYVYNSKATVKPPTNCIKSSISNNIKQTILMYQNSKNNITAHHSSDSTNSLNSISSTSGTSVSSSISSNNNNIYPVVYDTNNNSTVPPLSPMRYTPSSPLTSISPPSSSSLVPTSVYSHTFAYPGSSLPPPIPTTTAPINSSSSSSSSSLDITGGLCCIITVCNNFIVSDIACIDQVTEDKGPDIWLYVQTVVIDESNFKTGQFR